MCEFKQDKRLPLFQVNFSLTISLIFKHKQNYCSLRKIIYLVILHYDSTKIRLPKTGQAVKFLVNPGSTDFHKYGKQRAEVISFIVNYSIVIQVIFLIKEKALLFGLMNNMHRSFL